MLSDSNEMPLPSDESSTIIGFLLSSDGVNETDFHDIILLPCNGNLINLAFKAETAEEAQKGLESLFSGFLKAIIKHDQKSLSAKKNIRQQYDEKLLLIQYRIFVHLSILQFIIKIHIVTPVAVAPIFL
ncbi:hypothetical protein X471_00392 [Bartonella bacilliformis str. Heidi Mejia]|uniref:hypothetical protein n=1 Tax=Bartonella bacilliformis TaxID=774 RepID=UPI00044ABE78|nr:hypothetical protein X471_00392 [Bartonella bacilliformis str. Heidi Mejia]KEG18826.1 hypothetical protein H707_00557 [Bartonella bacilliformis Hosp800-02]KEG23934.1 hypothetical protein H708_00564 [Bartonella bacilliformis VAB9028]KEG24283.1 hypothetical protein H706_00567 [Bartonella bacilliformis CAR600-02]